MEKAILVKQVKSTTQSNPKQKATLKALGLRGVGSEIFRKDSRAIRGMLNKVRHLIAAEQTDVSKTPRPVKAAQGSKGYKIVR